MSEWNSMQHPYIKLDYSVAGKILLGIWFHANSFDEAAHMQHKAILYVYADHPAYGIA